MIIDGWGLGRAALQAGLLPTRAGAPAELPGAWAEEFHLASSLRPADLATTESARGPGADGGLSRRHIEELLAAGAQPEVDVTVVVRVGDDLPPGAYGAGSDGALRPLPTVDPVDPAWFCRAVSAADVAPSVVIAVVGPVPHAWTARGLRNYRHGLLAAGRFGLAVERAAADAGLRASTRADFADDAANRQLGLLGSNRACLLMIAVDG